MTLICPPTCTGLKINPVDIFKNEPIKVRLRMKIVVVGGDIQYVNYHNQQQRNYYLTSQRCDEITWGVVV